MDMTIEQLYNMILIQQEQINKLQENIKALKNLSDLNDYWLREMIDTLTESVDNLMDDHCCCEKYKITHELNKVNKKKGRESIRFSSFFFIFIIILLQHHE